MIRHLARAAKRLHTDEKGNSLALVALALPMLIGGVGLAVDTAHWIVLKRQLQAVADSAAMSGSFTALKGGDIDYAVDEDATRNRGNIERMQTRTELYAAIGYHDYEALDQSIIATVTPEGMPRRRG